MKDLYFQDSEGLYHLQTCRQKYSWNIAGRARHPGLEHSHFPPDQYLFLILILKLFQSQQGKILFLNSSPEHRNKNRPIYH